MNNFFIKNMYNYIKCICELFLYILVSISIIIFWKYYLLILLFYFLLAILIVKIINNMETIRNSLLG